eukprot:1180560-Prorocentrum_minimum.AAC.1
MDQSDTGSAGIFSQWTNQMQVVWVYSHDGTNQTQEAVKSNSNIDRTHAHPPQAQPRTSPQSPRPPDVVAGMYPNKCHHESPRVMSRKPRLHMLERVYSHNGPIRCRNHGYILMADQSDEHTQHPQRDLAAGTSRAPTPPRVRACERVCERGHLGL